MITYVYCVKDDLSGKFSNYGSFLNKSVANREFQKACNANGVPAADLSLYESGSFDDDTGILDPYSAPIFVSRGKKVNEISD